MANAGEGRDAPVFGLRNDASGEFKQDLETELQMAQQHLQLARQFEQKLKDRPLERASRRPESNK
jgi:hypothetical protein